MDIRPPGIRIDARGPIRKEYFLDFISARLKNLLTEK